jgi:hypothetical protein
MATVKQDVSLMLVNVPDEFIFWCHNGHVLRNMSERAGELKVMSDGTYSFHVTMEKNDFANWVRDIIKDEWLAASLLKARNRNQAARAVGDRVKALGKK